MENVEHEPQKSLRTGGPPGGSGSGDRGVKKALAGGRSRRRSVAIVAAAVGLAGVGPTMASADDCANAQFRTGTAASLPECRAYEQASPAVKGDADVVDTGTIASLNGGDSVYTNGATLYADADAVLYDTAYLSQRQGDIWGTRGMDPPLMPLGSTMLTKATFGVSEDGTKAVMTTTRALTPGAIEGGSNLYIRDLTQPASYRLVVANSNPSLTANLLSIGGHGRYFGGNSDLSAFAFVSPVPLVAGVPSNVTALYLWHDGELSVASKLANGTVLPSVGAGSNSPDKARHRVSEDGTRVWFTTGSPSLPAPLYQYVEGQGAVLISRSHRTGDDPTVGQAVSAGNVVASEDGRTIYFNITYKSLLDGAPDHGLYRWTADGTLTDLTPATGYTPQGALREVSPDGRYAWTVDTSFLKQVTAIDTTTKTAFRAASLNRPNSTLELKLSPNGRRAAFTTAAGVDGVSNANAGCHVFGNPNDDGYCRNVYTWNVDAPSQAAKCLSCGPAGMVRHGDAPSFGFQVTGFDGRLSRAITDDGRVFFDTGDRLLPADSNDVLDVYEYQPDQGLSLISTGNTEFSARFGDISENGRDVFFVTSAPLVPQDNDVQADLYTARIGGGIAAQQVAPAGSDDACSGDACRPAPTSRPDTPFTGSAQAPIVGPSPTFTVKAPKASTLRTAARTGRLTLPVKVNAAGTIRATLSGTIGGRKNRTAASGSRKATKAGTVSVALKLSSASRAQLRRTGRLSLRLRVDYSESISSYAKTLTFKKAKTTTKAASAKKGGSR